MCVGCAGAVVAPMTAAVRRVAWRKRVQYGPYTNTKSEKSPRVRNSKIGGRRVKIALWGSDFSSRPMAAASAPPRLPAVLALAAMFCELQLPAEDVYGRRTICTGSPWQRTGEASLVARLVSKAGNSAPGESRARLGLARPNGRTGRSWAALLGEPWDSAGEFGP